MKPSGIPQQYNEFSSWRGTYDQLKTYDKGEAVFYVDSSYVCLQYDVIGVAPDSDPTKWALLAAGGAAVHPNLATHDAMGIATDAELGTHTGAAAPHSGHETPAGAQGKVDTHAAAGDPHPGYVTETAHGGTTPSGHHAQLHAAAHGTGQGDEVTPASIGASATGHGHAQLHDEAHAKEDHSGAALPGSADESLGAHYLDVAQVAAPANPVSGTRRLFVDSADGKLKVRTSGGSSVSLEEQGGGATFGSPTGNIDIGDAAQEGSSGDATRADHQHQFSAPTAGYPQDVAAAEGDGVATTPARADHVHAHGSGFLPNAHHNQSHGSSDHSGATLPGAADEALGAHYLDVAQTAAPANPSAGTRRLFVDSADGKLKVRTSAGSSVSLEEQGGGVTFGAPTGQIDIGDTNSEGVSSSASRADHEHAFPAPGAGYPVDVAAAEADGSATTPARSDHQHAHGTGYAGGHSDAEAAGAVATHEAAADPHTGYRKESEDHTHASTGLQGGLVSHAVLSNVLANDHHNQAHALTGADHTHSGGVAGKFMRETGASAFAFQAVEFSKGGTVLSPTAAINIIVWRAPFACTVTAVKGYRVGGTGATVNARKNGTSNHLASALSLTSADSWMDGGSVQNTAYAAGDKLEIMVVTVAGSPTQVAIQVDLTRP